MGGLRCGRGKSEGGDDRVLGGRGETGEEGGEIGALSQRGWEGIEARGR